MSKKINSNKYFSSIRRYILMVGEAILYRIIKKKNKRKEIKILDHCKYVYIHPLPCNHTEHSNGDKIIGNSWSGCYTTFHDACNIIQLLLQTLSPHPLQPPTPHPHPFPPLPTLTLSFLFTKSSLPFTNRQ